MPNLDLAKYDFQSDAENISRVKVSNLYVIQNPLSSTEISYIPRPSVNSSATIGSGPLRGIWGTSSSGSSKLFVVSGTSLYRVTLYPFSSAFVGSIPGTGVCYFTTTVYNTAIVSDGRLFLTDGITVAEVTIPDEQLAADVTSLDNYLIVGIEGSNKFYWIEPGNIEIDPLSFASAERSPDDVVGVAAAGDELWVIGQTTCEVFADSGSADTPFVRIAGRAYPYGLKDRSSLAVGVKDGFPCLIWVSSAGEVILAQGSPTKISNEAVEEKLKTATMFRGWFFQSNRHDFYVLTLDAKTFVFDLSTGLWHSWVTYGSTKWGAIAGTQIGEDVYTIDEATNILSILSDKAYDNTSDYLICEITGFIPILDNKPVPCYNICLDVNSGNSSTYGTNPIVEIRWSDDSGKNWSNYRQSNLGSKGAYDTSVCFRSLGLMKRPGRWVEIKFSDIQSFRLDGASFND